MGEEVKISQLPRSSEKNEAANILIVDDERTMSASLAEILRLEGYRVQTAGSGEEAIELVSLGTEPPSAVTQRATMPHGQKQAFDLALVDLKMPGIDGLEVLHFINQNAPETQVILLTAHGSLESAIEALRFGASDYLLKPARPAQILASVRKSLLSLHEQRRKRKLLAQLEESILALREADTVARAGQIDPSPPHVPGHVPGQTDLGVNYDDMEPGQSKQNDRSHFIFRLKEDLFRLGSNTLVDITRREIWQEQGDDQKKHRISILLSPAESKLLGVFLKYPGKVFNHQELVSQVQGYNTSSMDAAEVLRPLISRLRGKLKRLNIEIGETNSRLRWVQRGWVRRGALSTAGSSAEYSGAANWIVNVRGTGYVFDLPEFDYSEVDET